MRKTFTISSAYFLLMTFSWLSRAEAIAQNIGINGTGANAHPSALLDLDSSPTNNTGFAMPRLTTTQRLLITSPVNGLLVYDTNLDGYYRFSTTNSKWDCATTPAGTINHFGNVTSPLGYLTCDGSAISLTTYPELFNAINTLYGIGDGTTTFNLPDLRGEFIRGAALTGTVDAGRVLGSIQLASTASNAIFGVSGGSLTNEIGNGESPLVLVGSQQNWSAGGNTTYTRYQVRPRNIALLPCIKY